MPSSDYSMITACHERWGTPRPKVRNGCNSGAFQPLGYFTAVESRAIFALSFLTPDPQLKINCDWNATACVSVFNKYDIESRWLIFPAQARGRYDWICWVINVQWEPHSQIKETVSLYATEISTRSRWCHPEHKAETLTYIAFFLLNQCKTLVEFIGGMEETGVLRKMCQILEQDHEGTSVESFEMSSNEKHCKQQNLKTRG